MAWPIVVLFVVLQECWCYPVDWNHVAGSEEVWGPVVASLSLLVACSVIALLGCVCCRHSKTPAFQREDKAPDVAVINKEFTDTTSSHSLSTAGFVNPLAGVATPASASTEFTIFPPPGVTPSTTVLFEPLPDIRPRVEPPPPLRPASFNHATRAQLTEGPSFPRDRLKYLQELGKGWFGKVVEGEALVEGGCERVVVKILHEDAVTSDHALFLQEVAHLRSVNHENVLRVLGVCLEAQPLLTIMELCPQGDLKNFLLQHRGEASTLAQRGDVDRLMCELAAGLKHLASAGFVHTDLAARNCLLNSDLTLKIGDYGTSIDTFREEYYCVGDVALPIRWCAPETLVCTDATIQTREVTSSANVWSLGVVLWEILEFGQLPYADLTDDEVLLQVLGPSKRVPHTPSMGLPLSTYLYQVMQLCWREEKERPTSAQVHAMLLRPQAHESFEQRWSALRPNASTLKPKSPSLQNLHGSLEDIHEIRASSLPSSRENLTSPQHSEVTQREVRVEDITIEIEDEDARQIHEAIQDLDDALALEKTSSSEHSSTQSTPRRKHRHALDVRLESDSEEEGTWKRRVERGDLTEKVRQKSKSVQDLMVLTHIDSSDHSSDDDAPRPLIAEAFKSEGNICGAVVIEGLLDSFRQLHKLAKIDDDPSISDSFINKLEPPFNQFLTPHTYLNNFLSSNTQPDKTLLNCLDSSSCSVTASTDDSQLTALLNTESLDTAHNTGDFDITHDAVCLHHNTGNMSDVFLLSHDDKDMTSHDYTGDEDAVTSHDIDNVVIHKNISYENGIYLPSQAKNGALLVENNTENLNTSSLQNITSNAEPVTFDTISETFTSNLSVHDDIFNPSKDLQASGIVHESVVDLDVEINSEAHDRTLYEMRGKEDALLESVKASDEQESTCSNMWDASTFLNMELRRDASVFVAEILECAALQAESRRLQGDMRIDKLHDEEIIALRRDTSPFVTEILESALVQAELRRPCNNTGLSELEQLSDTDIIKLRQDASPFVTEILESALVQAELRRPCNNTGLRDTDIIKLRQDARTFVQEILECAITQAESRRPQVEVCSDTLMLGGSESGTESNFEYLGCQHGDNAERHDMRVEDPIQAVQSHNSNIEQQSKALDTRIEAVQDQTPTDQVDSASEAVQSLTSNIEQQSKALDTRIEAVQDQTPIDQVDSISEAVQSHNSNVEQQSKALDTRIEAVQDQTPIDQVDSISEAVQSHNSNVEQQSKALDTRIEAVQDQIQIDQVDSISEAVQDGITIDLSEPRIKSCSKVKASVGEILHENTEVIQSFRLHSVDVGALSRGKDIASVHLSQNCATELDNSSRLSENTSKSKITELDMCDVASKAIDDCDVASKAIDDCDVASKATDYCDVASRAIDNCDVANRGTDNCNVASKATDYCDVANRAIDNCDVANRGTDNCNVASKATDYCDVASKAIDNCDVANRGTDNCNVASRGTDNCDVANRGTDNCNVASRGTDMCDVASRAIESKAVVLGVIKDIIITEELAEPESCSENNNSTLCCTLEQKSLLQLPVKSKHVVSKDPVSMIAFEPTHPKHGEHRLRRIREKDLEFKLKSHTALHPEPVGMIAFAPLVSKPVIDVLDIPVTADIPCPIPDTTPCPVMEIPGPVIPPISTEELVSEEFCTIAFEYVPNTDLSPSEVTEVSTAASTPTVIEVFRPKRLEQLCEEALVLDMDTSHQAKEQIILDSNNLAEEICKQHPLDCTIVAEKNRMDIVDCTVVPEKHRGISDIGVDVANGAEKNRSILDIGVDVTGVAEKNRGISDIVDVTGEAEKNRDISDIGLVVTNGAEKNCSSLNMRTNVEEKDSAIGEENIVMYMRTTNIGEDTSIAMNMAGLDCTNIGEESSITMNMAGLDCTNITEDNASAMNRLDDLIRDSSSESLLSRDSWSRQDSGKSEERRVTPEDERSSDSGFRDKYNLEDIEGELETFAQLGTPSSDSGLERTPHDDLKSFDTDEGDEFWKQQMASLQQAAGKTLALFQEAADTSPCEEERVYEDSWFRKSEEDNSYVSFNLDDECVAAIRSELQQKLPKLDRHANDGDEEVKREDITIHYNIYPAPLSPILEEQESLASSICSPIHSPVQDSLSSSGSNSPRVVTVSPLLAESPRVRCDQFEADIRAALEQLDSPNSVQDSPKSVQYSAKCIQDNPRSVENSAMCLQDDSKSMQDSPRCVQDSVMSVQDSIRSVEDSDSGLQDSPSRVEDSDRCMQDSARAVNVSPLVTQSSLISDSPRARSEQFEADIRAALEQCSGQQDSPEEDVLFVDTETNEATIVESPMRGKLPYLAFVNGQKVFTGAGEQWVEEDGGWKQTMSPSYLEQFDAVTSFSEPDPEDSGVTCNSWMSVPSTRAPMPSPEEEQARRVGEGDAPPPCNTPEWDSEPPPWQVQGAPEWESDTASEGSSSSGEFVWREGDRDTEVKLEEKEEEPQPVTSPCKPFVCEFPMSVIEEEDEESESSDTEFVPSSWNSEAAPSRSSLRSPDKKVDPKKNVSFKREKYHCVYEYPREASDNELEDLEARRPTSVANPAGLDYASYADWEMLEDDLAETGDQDTDPDSSEHSKPEPFDFYKLSSIDCDFNNGLHEDGEFFISSSARPFHLNTGFSSQFFPGLASSDSVPVSPGGSSSSTNSTTPPSPLSPTMGELRHTRDKLKLDLSKFSLTPLKPKSPVSDDSHA